MLMSDLKPLAVTEFNLYITDVFARDYFSDCFDLWEDDTTDFVEGKNGYKAVIKRYVNKIDAEIQNAQLLLKTTYTKKTDTETNSTNLENILSENITEKLQTNSEFTRTARQYPDGYINTADASYIRAQDINGANTTADDTTENRTDAKNAENDTTLTSSDVDIIAKSNLLKTYDLAFGIIEKCVFELVATIYEGVF